MSFASVLSLLGGLSLFLFGMKVMGDGLERAAGARLKNLLAKMTRNRLLGVLMGVGVTAVVQSSSATTVMVVGFVNAKLLSLSQAVGVIMGANIGTTVTSLLLSIKLDIGSIFAFVGLVMLFAFKKNSVKQVGMVFLGLGVLFCGMNLMSQSMAPLREWPLFMDLMRGVSNPLLGILLGAGITAVIQSSSASVGILQVLAAQGLMGMETAFFILLGQNIGTCVTALIASSGTGVNARRAAMVHLLFNVIGTLLFFALAMFLPIPAWIAGLAPDNIKLQIAFTHIIFNVVSTVVMLPFAGLLETLSRLLVRGEEPAERVLKMEYFDPRLLATPAIAAEQLYIETCRMGTLAKDNVLMALSAAMNDDTSGGAQIEETEELVDYLEEAITEALITVKALDLSDADNRRVGALFHVTNDFERVSDHATNFMEIAQEREKRHVKFSDKAQDELRDMIARVGGMLEDALHAFRQGFITSEQMMALELQEENVDKLTEKLRDAHIERLKDKKCAPKSGVLYLEILQNLERVGDHAMNIAGAVAVK